ncbi:unnamed protein product [marine sediment metagenome]|uniref:Uncharacterized protein n=1 Tax=marine sediment metagenome TaxID=412755 RepID=X0VT19_9ZZZZ
MDTHIQTDAPRGITARVVNGSWDEGYSDGLRDAEADLYHCDAMRPGVAALAYKDGYSAGYSEVHPLRVTR